ncbi:hypothetical protein DFH08DRAFT_335090 [Mycena albidolilacea]|uniref:ATP synthase protein MI25 n=1 Tax=Mycena albidolilacea TaxID=1033008 RepID=A0AAD6ZKD3_9AGAR|nr:hypothetical protein DFH08DRAFT_335090 [Mycena albidolilacea]
MPDLIVQLLPLALTPVAAVVPNGIQRWLILTLAALYFGGFVVLPNLPSVRLKKLEKYIDETVQVHTIAVQELENDPRFVTETSWRVARIKLSVSILRTKTLGGKDVPWNNYPQHLRGLLFHVGECQRNVHEIRISVQVSETSTFRIQVLREK